MSFLRTISTRRLLAGLVSVIATCLACSAIAIAATSGGSVPPPATLAQAIHGALTGPAVNGVSADVTFTNNLFSGASIETDDPLIAGASGRLWATHGHLRIELQTNNGDAEIVENQNSFWAYDPSSNTVYEGSLPAPARTGAVAGTLDGPAQMGTTICPQNSTCTATLQSQPSTAATTSQTSRSATSVPSTAEIQAGINELSQHVHVSAPRATDIGGQPAYSVTLAPKSDAGLLGAIRIGFDAGHAVPLDFALIPRGTQTPALALGASNVSYGRVASSVFRISPPAGAHVVHIQLPGSDAGDSSGSATPGATSAGPTQPGGPAVSVVGQGLGAVIVAKRPASGSAEQGSGPAGPLPLQHVTIDGASGQQLATSLGTVLEFTRGGVSHLLGGSVTPAALDAVARGL